MMEEDRVYNELREEAPMPESVGEEASTGLGGEEPQVPWQRLLDELMPNDQVDEALMESHMSEQLTPETPTEVNSATEASTPETPTTGMIPDTPRRPPHWLQSTATQTKLQRSLHTWRLENEIADYSMNREEIRRFGGLETRRFLMGPSLPPPMDAEAWIEADVHGDAPDSAKVNALLVPQNRLQLVRFNDDIRERDINETSTAEEMARMTMPTPYETWKMEKECVDLREALGIMMQNFGEDERVRDHRARMWSRSANNRIDMFRSRGYGSSFREVISIDEEWPEEDWASAGLVRPDASFVERFEAKMRMRPVLVRGRRREPC
ncbi:uncharacterized protein Triagg1_2183 [Trichoderma aggressivum f. europaeum]|uniref:Uncharacterized protein n=1 Tax=Trichoderma aggressivum f. europaeum TaxID=173218 RepID=A0AAE1IKS3_9HYPO|nr:hypothetical protein Triagg1_2183 [Trichoderma aggressivum f. europaeum]